MGRHATYDRDEVLGRAMTRFWRHGYEGTSVRDLVDVTGVNRASMYATFGDKRGLFLASVRHYLDRVSAERVAALDAPGDALPAVRHFLDDVVEFSLGDGRRLGCLLTNTAVELAPHDPEIEALLKRSFAGVERAFRRTLERARERGEIGPGRDPARLARFLVGVVQGLRVLARTNPSRRALRDVVDTAMEALRGPT